MSEANELRGELALELEGKKFVLRPSYKAIVAMEKATGKSIEQLADAAHWKTLPIEAAGVIVAECVRAQGEAVEDKMLIGVNAERLGHMILEAGKRGVQVVLALLLSRACTGGYTAQGEAKPTTTE